MEFKFLTKVNGQIKSFTVPFRAERNGEILDVMNEIYFSGSQHRDNYRILLEDLKINVCERSLSRVRHFETYNDFIKMDANLLECGISGGDENITNYTRNVYFNMAINYFNNPVFNAFLYYSIFGNSMHNPESLAIILKKENLSEFADNLQSLMDTEKVIYSNRYETQEVSLIEHIRDNLIEDDIIVLRNFYFDEELDKRSYYKNPIDLINSEDFQSFLKEDENKWEGYSLSDLEEVYFDKKQIKPCHDLLFNVYKEEILTNIAKKDEDYLNIADFEGFNFNNNEIVEKLIK